jgi:hypothetical protein
VSDERPTLSDQVLTWAGRLDILSEVLERRAAQHGDTILGAASETAASIAAEMRTAAAHVSTWPAPGGADPEG